MRLMTCLLNQSQTCTSGIQTEIITAADTSHTTMQAIGRGITAVAPMVPSQDFFGLTLGAIGCFPNHWSAPIGTEISRTNRQIKALTQALVGPFVDVSSDNSAVRVSARSLNGALYVIAVNTTGAPIQARIDVNGIAGRSATVLGGGGPAVGADDKGFSDTFGPLDARVYVIPPAGW